MENPSGEKSDGLEIISVGTLYEGSWDKKYWSCSRGKDRYPYPIGYHAVRTHIGITYRMEIREGLKGPLFVITSTDGESCTGQTPDIAWESFQKKGGPRVKLALGKRFSCRIDGVELFGFRNPLVQRLLRELVTNVNGTAELSALSSSFYKGNSRLELEAQPRDSCTYPDLSPYLVKPQRTRKRSRKHNLTTINAVSGTGLKRFQSQDLLDDAEFAITKGGNWRPYHEERCLTTSTSDVDCQVHKDSGASAVPLDVATSVDREHRLVDPEDSVFTCLANDLSQQEKHCHRSVGAEMEGCNSILKTEDNDGETMSLTESKADKDLDLCAPDTLEVLQDDITDSAEGSYKENSCNVTDQPVVANAVVSDMHLEEDLGTFNSNASSEKNDLESVGQELANSMMTLLLPQALPLLKKRRKKRATTSSSEICLFNRNLSLDLSGAKTPEGNDELYSIAEAIPPVRGSEFLSPEGVNSVIPDSLEDGQFGDHIIDQKPLRSDFAKDNRAPFDQMECNPDTSRLHGCVGGDQERSDFHVATGEKIEFFSGEVTNIHRGQADPITLGNKYSIEAHRLSATGYTKDDRLISIESSAFISQKEVDPRTADTSSFNQMPGLALSNRNYNGPLTESIICRNTREDCVPETYTATKSASGNILNKVSFGSETKPDEQQCCFNTEKGTLRPKGMLSNISSNASQSEPVVVHDSRSEDASRLVDMSTSDNNCCILKTEPNKDSENVVELLGCYLHPTPVLSILLSTHGDDIHICVLCGLRQDRNRTFFIYKVPIKEQKGGCPSFLGYTSIILPNSRNTFPRENAFERSGWQFTPDGQYLVLQNSIKAPSCRSQSILCSCSVCKSDCLEENAVKVVHVKLGFVTPVVKLKTVESVHCILVCEPSHLVAAEEDGGLHVWAMNSEWGGWVEEFVLPGLEYISPCIVELKRIPKCDSLIVGHDGFGNFGLWDISKRILLSRFSATGSSVFQVLPIGFFSLPRKGPSASADVEEQIKGIMAATEVCFSDSGEDHAFLSSNGEDMAVWLLISAAGDSEAQYEHQANGIKPCSVGCWRLALLVKNTLILGSALDPRASAVDASSGYGVIGTSDGLVYMWELTTGTKLVDLPYSKGRCKIIEY
ncbi:FY-rich [Macleaya cordata]|uniref:FY-rich n=1 Tax=Macleaya cordata TaxID=56857 RepID=A0A200QKM5_MACCD|nr:FY-rich [Macleaya cordata]